MCMTGMQIDKHFAADHVWGENKLESDPDIVAILEETKRATGASGVALVGRIAGQGSPVVS